MPAITRDNWVAEMQNPCVSLSMFTVVSIVSILQLLKDNFHATTVTI